MTPFKIGDRVKIGANPGTGPEPGSGYVAPDVAGASGTVIGETRQSPSGTTVFVMAAGYVQWIHPAHLTHEEAAQ